MEQVQVKEIEKINPAATANCFSKIFFCWLNPLFRIGYKRSLEQEDLYNVLPEFRSKTLGLTLQSYWDEECLKSAKELKKPSFCKAVIRCYWKSYSLLGIFTFIEEATMIVQPVLLGYLLRYFETYDPNDYHGLELACYYALGMSLSLLLLAVMHHILFFNIQKAGMKIRVAMCNMIFRKALCLSNSARGKTTTGQIVNLLSNDVSKFDDLTMFLHYLWVGPIQVAVVVALLWGEIGPSCLVGIALLIFLMPLQTQFGRMFSVYRSRTAVLTDHRIRTMNEVVTGMRIIKMYAWEKPFAALVSEYRTEEIVNLMKSSMLRAANMATYFSASKIIVLFTFAVYVMLGNTITASRVFVTVSLYGAIRLTVTHFFPSALEKLFESLVSIERIQTFLNLEELPKNTNVFCQPKDASVIIQELVCYWDKNQDAPSLQKISLSVGSRQLVAVIGPVGAGKSSLLSAILGELPLDKGVVKVKGQLTYACQQPWVFPGTIRDNILFGKELDPAKYEKVLRACALKRDMELLPDGDLTLIGDRGATLSGGQKARVNLARAVYQDADIYLLDDPLSAVDGEVGRHLFEKCICGILKDKPRILVTHQLQYLKVADQILVLKEGNVVAQGGYTDLQRSGLDFTSLLKHEEEGEGKLEELARSRTVSCNSLPNEEADQLPAEHTQTAVEEGRSQGTISTDMYYKYLRAGANIFGLVVLFVVNIVAQVAYILQDWWLSEWSNRQGSLTADINNNITNATEVLDIPFYLGIYGGLTAATVLFGLVRAMLFFYVLVKSTETLHKRMFDTILRAPVHFFDVNPIGRVLNRFSKDIGQMDVLLPITFVDACQVLLLTIGVIVVSAMVVPWILILVVPLLIIFLFLRRYFLQTSRDIKRLEGTTRSPVFSHLSSSLHGLWTIRAFRAEQRFQNVFDAHQDLHSVTWYLFLTSSRWFALRLDLLCAVFVIILIYACVLLRDNLGAGDVGLALSYAITLMGMFQWGVRQSAEVENLMTSVERVMEYTELESEAPWETEKRPPLDWPSQGLVTFDGVNFSYSADGPVVLRNMNAAFLPREKVGVVGRTGAGKSSLVSALFRLAEPQGKIYVDGILTSELGLHDLRQKMSIIPQDPVLFTDTMRKNLDPFNQHSDEELWNSLQEVHLKSVVEELPAKMETLLAESGSNFSVGQRQLVCLARAILRKNRILIIDEATAHVDPRTDELIQRTIREKFRDCTVLTIAHRLNTIIDSDRIMVLDAGEIQAYDAPYTLLQDPEGIFYKMVQQTGQQEAEDLLASAKQAYENKSQPSSKYGSTTNVNLVIHETPM
ncbi:multidrug resistance-associated protein 4-like isoform X1 [Gadus morhua]|uniref:multidrug resistance-associated protein 4-like isoform X1 n=1 Tax=Gadus morhua TaxID=8049 RepID=UPI0011B3DEB7|nr:multidrug resistance-associated protein 4-like isoform X1 [Gadus morhua]